MKKMEVTPLLWSLYLDYDEAMKVYEDEKNKFEYTGTDYGMDLYAELVLTRCVIKMERF